MQINQVTINPQASPINNGIPSDELLVPGPLVRSFVYDAFGRLVRTVSPWPEPGAAFTQYSTTRRYYYDGSRRIAEAWTDYIVTQSGGVTIASAIAAQAAQDAAAGQEQSSTSSLLEGEQIEFEEPVGGTTIVIKPITNLSRQYVWGPGDAGIDELVAQVDEVGRAMFAMQDAGGDVIAWFDRGSGPTGSTALLHSGAARTVAAATFDVYGQTLAWKAIDNLPPPSFSTSIGHKGLPYERFDVGLTTISGINGDISASGEVQYPTPQIASHATGLYYVRNRWLSPSTGRWLTRDPHATGSSVIGLSWHDWEFQSSHGTVELKAHVADSNSVYEYARGDAVNYRDPSGLFIGGIANGLVTGFGLFDFASDALETAGIGIRSGAGLAQQVRGYVISQMHNVDWALDWSRDDEGSTHSNSFKFGVGVWSPDDVPPEESADGPAMASGIRLGEGESREHYTAKRNEWDNLRKQMWRAEANNKSNTTWTKEDRARMKQGLAPEGWVVHHKQPLAAGGSNHPSNLYIMRDSDHKSRSKELHKPPFSIPDDIETRRPPPTWNPFTLPARR